MASPIADLSYRNYDGPIEPPRHRWWAIAKMGMRLTWTRKGFWVATLMAGWYYLGMIFVMFIVDQLAGSAPTPAGAPNPAQAFFERIVWKDQLLHGFSFGQLLMLIIALMLGVGAIANDNRANALLVYLSKPCTKLDYLAGKWFGVFLPTLVAVTLPATVFFLYAAMSYRAEGFFSQDPWAFPKALVVFAIAAGFHASLSLGFSSLFNQGRMAGAAYAGFYFLSNFVTQLMKVAFIEANDHGRSNEAVLPLVTKLYYCSVDGLNIGLFKALAGTDGTAFFNIPSRMSSIPAPPLWLPLAGIFTLSALGLLLAWRRIRAVEVVQ